MTQTKTIMTQKIITVPMGTSMGAANKLMKEKRIRHLPVIDDQERVIGIVSKKDFIYLDEPDEINVECLMSTPVYHVDQNTNLRSAILKMLEKKISCLLVADSEDQAVGIVTTDDMLWYLAHLLNEEETHKKSILDATKLLRVGEIAQKVANAGI